ncbi:2-oxoglutarate dehydrogenase complex dihydrolipoyllysine-residue succinyltransferase [Aliidiomarina quisquiliarum]|uniref:2-oxoglutarate dehydrogenase complex dihydrolipoyllysine-residue succinyltransferase n=1 Tax=Aliidiomarina quisquiliarum TaxID=2938947 RepID=UPI00208FB03D|nr:2-oxoglutarate dehydrogenase complex dihydrolipoyllysine-residue succinyltransferase [Aliidiomarina quisquiliarum]MCO4320935.1 2-oxoglutarate dehydrogenase complex dihydrolipoyllysine-residue succinyltransferase [Aliidiomarina quisquiliarum]
MAIEIKVPELPESVADGSIATWHVKEGDTVTRDQNLVDIETDKVVLEVVAEADGVIGKITAAEGDTVQGQQVIGTLEAGGAEKAPAAKEEAPAKAAAPAGTGGETVDVKVPELPESVAEATVATWHVKAGEAVTRDQNLVDIETDKVVLEVVAEADGVLSEIIHGEGANVVGQDVIGKLVKGATAAASEAAPAEATEDKESSDAVSPSVRRLLAEHDLKATDVKGTGKDGRVTKEDVEKHVKSASQTKAAPAPAAAPAPQTVSGNRTQKRVPMTRLRKTIATRLLDAKNSTAMLTTFNEVNMKPIMDLRKTYQKEFEERHGVRLGFMSFYVKAVVEALKRFPEVNASIDGDEIVYHNYFDVSIAVSTPRGLVTPIVRDADTLSLAEIESAIRELALKGRDGKLTLDEMLGGNFTITNGGVFGSLLSTPILNPPQSAILGMHKIQDRAMVVDGEIEILPMMYLALSYDHRIVDGKESVGFLVTVKNLLEDPQRLLLDI